MNQSSQERTDGHRVALVQARWHSEIVDQCTIACQEELNRLSNGSVEVEVFDAPGAFEIPLMARTLARTGRYAAVIGAALVVDGGIYRHDFVARTVIDGLMQAQMDADLPVLSAVLTPHNFQDTDEHRSFFKDHFRVKGREVASACMAVLSTRRDLAAAV